jgi:hypothetical protein
MTAHGDFVDLLGSSAGCRGNRARELLELRTSVLIWRPRCSRLPWSGRAATSLERTGVCPGKLFNPLGIETQPALVFSSTRTRPRFAKSEFGVGQRP